MSGSGSSGSNSKDSKSSNSNEGDEEEVLLFKKGSRVEVSSNEIGLKGVWFVGTIIETELASSTSSSNKKKKKKKTKKKKENKEMVVVVEYDNLLADEGTNKEPLREKLKISSFIRPLPPNPINILDDLAINDSSSSNIVFGKDDLVDAFHRDGWWVGVISNVIEESKSYEVFFDDPPEFLIFPCSSLRPHLDWVQGKWIRPHKSQSQSLLLLENNGATGVEGNQKRKRGRPPLQRSIISAKRAVASPQVIEAADATAAGKEASSSETNLKTKEDVQLIVDDVVFSDLTLLPGQQQEGITSTQSIMNIDPTPAADATEAGKGASSSETNLKAKEDVQLTDGDVVFGDLTLLPGEQQEGITPPQTIMNIDPSVSAAGSGTNINQLEASKENAAAAADAAFSTPTIQNNNIENLEENNKKNKWPFVKRSPLWPAIESTSIFQRTAQTVHFSFLDKVGEELREGLAIGYTVTFATMLENISTLTISDFTTTTIIQRYLGTLAELEEHGFDVEVVRVCLLDLLSLKATETNLQDESREVHRRIDECHLEKNQVVNKQSEIEAKLRELQEEHQAIALSMDLKDQEIAKLKSKEELINEGINNVNLDFQRRASASPL